VLWDNAAVLLESRFVIPPCPWHGVFSPAASLVQWLLQLTWRSRAAALKQQTKQNTSP